MIEYFLKLKSLNVKVELDLSNYATDLKNATGVDNSDFI